MRIWASLVRRMCASSGGVASVLIGRDERADAQRGVERRQPERAVGRQQRDPRALAGAARQQRPRHAGRAAIELARRSGSRRRGRARGGRRRAATIAASSSGNVDAGSVLVHRSYRSPSDRGRRRWGRCRPTSRRPRACGRTSRRASRARLEQLDHEAERGRGVDPATCGSFRPRPRTRARRRRRCRRRARPRSPCRSAPCGGGRTRPGRRRRGTPRARRCPGRPARSAGHRRTRWRPCTAGNSAGSPRWRPSANGTPSNQKNGPTPAVDPGVDGGAEVGDHPAHLHEVSGSGTAASRSVDSDAAQLITGKRSSPNGSHCFMSVAVEVRARRAVPADVGRLGDEEVGPAGPVHHVRTGAVDR